MGYRYIGSKMRILGEILPQIEAIVGKGALIADVMCGTAVVSACLRENGYRVIANDIMTYSYHHARVSLLFTAPPEFANAKKFIRNFYPNRENGLFPLSPYERILKALNNVPPEKGYFWKEFCVEGNPSNTEKARNYYSPENAQKIDGIRRRTRELWNTEQINDLERSLLLHDLIMAANDAANIAGTYGHYMGKTTGRAKEPLELKPTSLLIREDAGSHKVLQKYVEDVAGQVTCDLCYLDPPYMKRQYAANYHILETLACEDEPNAVGVSGLRPWRDKYSNFCTKTKIRDSFRKVLRDMNCPHFLISYSEDGLLTINELKKVFSEFGRVRILGFSHKRFKSNGSQLKPTLTEYLIYLEKACVYS